MKAVRTLWWMPVRSSALALSLPGGFGAMISVLALVDPIGAQMADDADPFATPPGSDGLWLRLAVSLALLGLGLWLFLHRRSAKAA